MPKKLNEYLTASNPVAQEGFNHGPDVSQMMSEGGMVEIPKQEFIQEHERLIPQLGGSEKKEQEEELKGIKAAFGTIAGSNFDVDSGGTRTASVAPQTDFEKPEDASYTPPTVGLNDLPMNQVTPLGQLEKPATPSSTSSATPPPDVPQGTLPGMPPDVNPMDIASYMQEQKSKINKYGPEKQLDLERQLTAQRTGLPHALISGAKGFSDALMQGVARAGSSNNQQAYEDQQNALAKEQLGAFQQAGEQNMAKVGANRQVDMIDPKSTVSKAYQSSFAPLFQQMGISGDNVSKMSASQIATIAEISSKTMDYRMQQEMKKAMLDVQRMTAEGTVRKQESDIQKQESDIEQQKVDTGMKAAKGMQDRPWYQKLIEIAPPFKSEGTKTMEAQLPGNHPQTNEALDWAKANINDPRAKKILERLGGQ